MLLCHKHPIGGKVGDHLFSAYPKLPEKLISFIPWCAHLYQGVRNIFFLENFAFVLIEWSLENARNSKSRRPQLSLKRLPWKLRETTTFCEIIFNEAHF